MKTKQINKQIYKSPIHIVDYASIHVDNQSIEVDYSLGHSPFGYPKSLKLNSLSLSPKRLIEYPNNEHRNELSQFIRDRFRMDNETKVYFGGGAYHLLAEVLSNLFSQENRSERLKVMGPGPQFTNIKYLADRAELDYQSIELPLELTLGEKLATITKQKSSAKEAAVFYIDNPNNPTGDFAAKSVIKSFLDACLENDVVIIDEAYADLLPDEESSFNLLSEYPNLIVMRSYSKTFGLAGLRLGYMAMSAPLQRVYDTIDLIFNLNYVASSIALQCSQQSITEGFLVNVREKTKLQKEKFIILLRKFDISVLPTNPLVSILLAHDSQDFYNRLLKVGVNTSPGFSFQPTYKAMNDSYVRFRIPESAEDIVILEEKLKKIF